MALFEQLSDREKREEILSAERTEDHVWQIRFRGPSETYLSQMVYLLEIRTKPNYPYEEPKAKFLNKVFHPNVSEKGDVCVSILDASEWSPSSNMLSIVHSIRSLLVDPNPESPLNAEAGKLLKKDKKNYERTALAMTQTWAPEGTPVKKRKKQ